MFSAGFHLEPTAGVPKNVQRMAAKVSLQLQREELARGQSLDNTLQRLSREYQTEIRSIIGRENLQRYHALRRALRTRVREVVMKATPTVVGEQDIEEARLQAAEESRKFLGEIGFNMARASILRGEYHTRMHKVISEAAGGPQEPNYLVLPDMVPREIHNPWRTYQPPYPGWLWIYSRDKSDEPPWPICTSYLDAAAGQLGTFSQTHVSGADDSDFAYVSCRTAMRFLYDLTVAGRVELWMRLRCIDTSYSGWLKDEWGWSDSSCHQKSAAHLRVLMPVLEDIRYSTILDYGRTGTDANWSRVYVEAGEERWAHLFSADAYPGGTRLLLEVGTSERNYFWTNDVSIHSAMTMRWFLQNVYVRSTGEQ